MLMFQPEGGAFTYVITHQGEKLMLNAATQNIKDEEMGLIVAHTHTLSHNEHFRQSKVRFLWLFLRKDDINE